jgi:hypothetical protein
MVPDSKSELNNMHGHPRLRGDGRVRLGESRARSSIHSIRGEERLFTGRDHKSTGATPALRSSLQGKSDQR